MAKRKAKFESLSTPGARQDLSNYLVELVFLRSNHGIKLPPKFWRLTKYKFRYMREIKAVRKFIKQYGEPAMLHIAKENYLTTWTDYAKNEVLLQKYKEKAERLNSPKDLGSVESIKEHRGEDLRQRKSFSTKKGLFEKLQEIENDN